MGDERGQQSVERYEEAAISLLMEEYAEAEGARLLREFEEFQRNGELPEIPAELDEKCRKLIDKAFAAQRRKARLMRLRSFAAKAAVIILTLCGLSTITVLSVDAFRIPVLNFLMDQSGRYSTVVFDENANIGDAAQDSVVARLEINLPEGYKITQSNSVDSSWLFLAVNSEERVIYLEVEKSEWGLNVDTEDQGYQQVDFCGHVAAFQDKEGYCLMWVDDKTHTVYTLCANGLQIDAFWKLAYSIAE